MTQKLQFETQTAVYAGAFYNGMALDDTTFGLIVVPSEGVSLQEAEDAMDKTVLEFIEAGVDDEQLARLKMQFRASEIYARDNVKGLANAYGAALTSGLQLQDIEAWPDIVQGVTAEEIIEAAKAVFVKEKSVTGWLMKDEGDAK